MKRLSIDNRHSARQSLGRFRHRLFDVGRKLRVKVGSDISATIRASRPDVAVLCTSSSLKKVIPEFEAVLKLKVPIVSTTEELAYPVKSNASVSSSLSGSLVLRGYHSSSSTKRCLARVSIGPPHSKS